MSNSTPAATTAVAASTFDNSLGVNTQLWDSSAAYASLSLVEADLAYLGIVNIRDTFVPWPQMQPEYQALAALGYKFDFMIAPASENIPTFVSDVAAFVTAHPGSVIAIEGPDEPNIFPVEYDGGSSLADAALYQQALYAAARALPALNSIPVYNLSVAFLDTAQYEQLGNLSASANYANSHVYLNDAQPPQYGMGIILPYAQIDAPGLPTVITETGYETNPADTQSGVDQTVQAKLTLDTLMDAFKDGVSKTYIFQLFDDSTGDWGLFTASGTPKLVATAIHNLTTILADPGGTSAFTPGSLSYAVPNLPANGNQLLLEKSNGTFDLVLWAEAQIWNPTTETEVVATTETTTVDFGQTEQLVEVFDPLAGTTPIATYNNVQSIQVALTDHPLVIEIPCNTDFWSVGKSGNFVSGSNWTLGAPPTSSQDASINVAGTYTVSSTANTTVEALDVGDPAATLLITSGTTFSATGGAGGNANLGAIVVQNGAALDIGGGTFTNSGSITLSATTNTTALGVAGNLTLTGAGSVTLEADSVIVANGGAATLTVLGNTIAGAGTIGGTNLSLINSGTLEGTSSAGLVFDYSKVTNSTTIEALGTNAKLALNYVTVTNNGSGIILASGSGANVDLNYAIVSNTGSSIVQASGSGANVELDYAQILGGTLKTSGSNAVIEMVSGTTNLISGATIAAGATVETTSGSTLWATGINNSGTLFASGSGSTLDIGVVNGGVVEVGDGIADIQGSSSETVTFQSGGSGGLQLDSVAAYTGAVSGFGQNTHQFIDLSQIKSSGSVSLTYSPSSSHPTSSGVLTVSSGGKVVASIDLVGQYVTSNFLISSGTNGSVKIVDPPVVAGGVQSANVVLLANYIATSFVTAAGGHGAVVTDNSPTTSHQLNLAPPRA